MSNISDLNNKTLDNLPNNNFSFIHDSDVEISKLETKIVEQHNLLSQLNLIISSNRDNPLVKEIIDKANIYSNIVDDNINKLSDIKKSINSINDSLKDLLLLMQTNDSSIDYEPEFNNIKDSISEYYSKLDIIQKDVSINNTNIINFLSTETIQISNLVKINEDNNENIVASTINTNLNDTEIPENKILTISEKQNRVFLPYTKSELKEYLRQYPDKYSSYQEVIKSEFVYPLSYYSKHPTVSRFRETYSLIYDREGKSIFEALKYSFEFMFRYEINPAVIAACKTQSQFETYLDCLEHGKLGDFSEFIINFEINPSKVYNHSKFN